MTTFRFKSTIALLLIGFMLGFCTSQFLFGCNAEPSGKPASQVKELIKKTDANHAVYTEKISVLEKVNANLQQKLLGTQAELQKAKRQTAIQEGSLKLLAKTGYKASERLKKTDQPDAVHYYAAACDSLISEVNSYLDENKRKDSLYEEQIFAMDSVITVKDAIIQADASAYNSLHQLFSQTVEQQELLLAENVSLRKQIKRQKRKGKLLGLGGIIVSGAAANYLIRH